MAFLVGEGAGSLAPETLKLRRATIRYLHRVACCPVPTDDASVSETLADIQRAAARQGQHERKRKPVTVQVLQRLLAPVGDDWTGLRDRALLLVGFAGALQRSDLAAIHVRDLESTERGFGLTLDETKGSQAEALMVPLPYGDTELCPVRALERWLTAASIINGPGFRRIWRATRESGGDPPSLPRLGAEALTARSVALVVQARAVSAGFERRELAVQSLKRGAPTTGMDRGLHPTQLKRLGRHESYDVLGEYLEFGDLFEGHPLGGVL